jgi:hypothetical protein
MAEPGDYMPSTNSVSLLFSFLVATADPSVVIEGEIFDSQCVPSVHFPNSRHAETIKNSTVERNSQEFTGASVANDREYVLVDTENNKLHYIAEQQQAAKFSGKRVLVRGIYDRDGVLSISRIEAR